MNQILQLEKNLITLKLSYMLEEIDNICERLNSEQISYLLELTNNEIEIKLSKAQNIMLRTAGLPSIKTIDEFDFSFNTSIPEHKILKMTQLDFLETNSNIIFVGSSGVGKTHMAIAIGVNAAKKRISTYFVKCKTLISNLRLAYEENRLESRLKHYCKYKVLIIDEMGFLPIDDIDSKLLFQLIDLRYETKATIITTNITFDLWPSIFSDAIIAGAILDRLLHHSYIFKITGDSYRLKDVQSEV